MYIRHSIERNFTFQFLESKGIRCSPFEPCRQRLTVEHHGDGLRDDLEDSVRISRSCKERNKESTARRYDRYTAA